MAGEAETQRQIAHYASLARINYKKLVAHQLIARGVQPTEPMLAEAMRWWDTQAPVFVKQVVDHLLAKK